jgi:heptosyltransferase I
MPQDGQPRILITRLSAIGDCILTMPLLCALRRALPDAMIAWAVQPLSAPLLRDHECLDQLIEVPRGWLKSPSQILQLRRKLRKYNFDTVLDPQGLLKSAAASWLSGARQRIGFAPPQGREQSHWLNNILVRPRSAHIVDMQLELLGPLGIEAGPVEFRVPLFAADASRVAGMLHQVGLDDVPFAVINPGAAWRSKRWEVDRYAQVAEYLAIEHDLPTLVVWAGAAERAEAEGIVAAAHGAARLAPATNLAELAGLLRRSRLLLATTSIGLFGTTRPEHSGPYGAAHRAVQAYYQAGSCRQRRQAANDAMRAITVRQICDACRQLLQRPHTNAA